MKPTNVVICGIEYKIIYMDKPSDVDIYKRDSLWGQIDYWTRTIRIYDVARSMEDLWQTILHEVLHGIMDALKIEWNKSENEDKIDLLALGLCDTLFRNSWIKDA